MESEKDVRIRKEPSTKNKSNTQGVAHLKKLSNQKAKPDTPNEVKNLDNPLKGYAKERHFKPVGYSTAGRLEEVKVAHRKKKLEAVLKQKHIEVDVPGALHSDSDMDGEEKAAFKKTAIKIRKKVNRLKTFSPSVAQDTFAEIGQRIQPETSVQEDLFKDFEEILSPKISNQQNPKDNDATKLDKKRKAEIDPPKINDDDEDYLKLQQDLFKDFGDILSPDVQIKQSHPEVTQRQSKIPRSEYTNKTDGSQDVSKRGIAKSVKEVINQPLPLQDFYSEIDSQKGGGKSKGSRLDPNNVVSSYYVQMRTCTALYGSVAHQYKFISSKLPKSMRLNTDNTPESLEEIKKNLKNIVGFGRSYEQLMMRNVRPGSGERQCVNGNECEFLNMYGKVRLIGVECLTPKERLEFEKPEGKLPLEVRPCILCRRKNTTIHHLNARRTCGSMSTKWMFQDYYNFVEQDGEYLLSDCIMSSENEVQTVIYPVVQHIRSRYAQVQIEEGVWMYLQVGYKKPEEVREARLGF